MTKDRQNDLSASDDAGEAGQPLNREQRRAEQFGSPDHHQDNLLPESENNSGLNAFGGGDAGLGDAGEVGEAHAGRQDQDVTRMTGAGTGGAVESGGRLPHHEGMNPPQNQPNS